jgi:purine-nucleoside phosphorylase
MTIKERVIETSKFLVKKGFTDGEVGIILGTGLGALAEEIDIETSIAYEDIPNFPIATVEFHKGKLIYGKLEGKNVISMQGRFHYYEGYTMDEVVFPVRVLCELGIKNLLISNAAGGINLEWKKGELMIIDDHINLQPDNPLRGKEAADFGPIFTDMSSPYSKDLNDLLRESAKSLKIKLNTGV